MPQSPTLENSRSLNFLNATYASTVYYRCTVHFDIHKVHTPTNALFIKLDNILKFTSKITLICSYMFRSTTIIREPSLEPSQSYKG